MATSNIHLTHASRASATLGTNAPLQVRGHQVRSTSRLSLGASAPIRSACMTMPTLPRDFPTEMERKMAELEKAQPLIQKGRASVQNSHNATSTPQQIAAEKFRRSDNRKGIDLENLVHRQDLANKAGVNVAKRTFFQKLGGFAVVGLLAAVMVTAGLLGAGLPFLVLGGMVSASALRMGGDAICAKLSLRNAQAIAEGREPPHDLPMGNDSVANLAYHATPTSWAPDTRKELSRFVSFATDATIQAASGFATGGASAFSFMAAGVGLVAVNHALRNTLIDRPSLEDTVQNADLLPAGESTMSAAENNVAPRSIEGRIQETAHQIASMKELIAQMMAKEGAVAQPVSTLQMLQTELAAVEAKLSQQVDTMALAVESLHIQANEQVSRGQSAGVMAGVTAALVSADTVVLKASQFLGLQGLNFAGSGSAELAMNLLALQKNNQQIAQAQDFVNNRQDYESLQRRIVEEKAKHTQLLPASPANSQSFQHGGVYV